MTATTAIALDPNLAMVIMGVIGIIVPLATLLVNFIQNSRIASDQTVAVRDVATKVERARQDSAVTRAAVAVEVAAVAVRVEEARAASSAHVDEKLEAIQNTLVNGPLTQALATIEKLKELLQSVAPNDARVQEILSQ